MSASRKFRRGLAASREARAQFPTRPPALGTVRRWLKQGVAEGTIERGPDEQDGKPGRPAHTYRITEAGKERAADTPDFKTQLTELQAKRALALTKKGMSEDRAIEAVTKGWRGEAPAATEATT